MDDEYSNYSFSEIDNCYDDYIVKGHELDEWLNSYSSLINEFDEQPTPETSVTMPKINTGDLTTAEKLHKLLETHIKENENCAAPENDLLDIFTTELHECERCSFVYADADHLRDHFISTHSNPNCSTCWTSNVGTKTFQDSQIHQDECTGEGELSNIDMNNCHSVSIDHCKELQMDTNNNEWLSIECEVIDVNDWILKTNAMKIDDKQRVPNNCELNEEQSLLVTSNAPMSPLMAADRPFACSERGCTQKFETLMDLNDHNYENHSNARPYLCTECNMRFLCKRTLLQHELSYHTGDVKKRYNPLKCMFCYKSYKTEKKITKHISMHYENHLKMLKAAEAKGGYLYDFLPPNDDETLCTTFDELLSAGNIPAILD